MGPTLSFDKIAGANEIARRRYLSVFSEILQWRIVLNSIDLPLKLDPPFTSRYHIHNLAEASWMFVSSRLANPLRLATNPSKECYPSSIVRPRTVRTLFSSTITMDAVKSDPSLPTSAALDSGAIDHNPSGKKIQVTSHNQYETPRLLRSDVDRNPMVQFQNWLSSAISPPDGQPSVHEPEAMTVCTSLPNGVPSARVVLLKQADDKGFVFYTNYGSRKSQELSANPYASIAIYWRELSRSVRVVGKAEKVSRQESVEYFNSRPRGSQIGAWASKQSQTLEDESVLEDRVKKVEAKFDGRVVECPEFWGGWRIVPL
jgi:pyridoxamine 5'-phosphate oxidase